MSEHEPPRLPLQDEQPARRIEQHEDNTPNDQPFPTNWVSKEDLLYSRPELADKISQLSPSEVAHLAAKVGDALTESYWLALGVVLDDFLKEGEQPLK